MFGRPLDIFGSWCFAVIIIQIFNINLRSEINTLLLFFEFWISFEMSDASRALNYDSRSDSSQKQLKLPVINNSLHPSGIWNPMAYKRILVKKAQISL